MAKLPVKVADRLASALKRYQPILASAKARDINESDTVVIVGDMLADLFGYDKYSEVTSEFAIRSTYCDLAVKLDGRLTLLVEVKAIGGDLKEPHIKQAVDYAANQGCEWTVLTNGRCWRAYRVTFGRPIGHELVLDIAMESLNAKKATDLELLWLLSKEGQAKSGLSDYHAQREALSRFTLGALIQSAPVLAVLRRELRRITPDARIDEEEIRDALVNEVMKREVLEGEKATAAKKLVSRAASRALRQAAERVAGGGNKVDLVTAPEL
jgi:hypothetical protein